MKVPCGAGVLLHWRRPAPAEQRTDIKTENPPNEKTCFETGSSCHHDIWI